METINLTCQGCRNGCVLEVILEKGKVRAVEKAGCRRGILNAQKQLEVQNGSK